MIRKTVYVPNTIPSCAGLLCRPQSAWRSSPLWPSASLYCCSFFDHGGHFSEIRVRPLGFEAPTVHSQGPYIIEDPFFLERVKDRLLQWQAEFGFIEGPVIVESYYIPELSIGIEDLPRHFNKFLKDPASFSKDEQFNYPEIIRDWTTDGNFVLWLGRDYYLNKDGEVI